jgi:hypothetical protein
MAPNWWFEAMENCAENHCAEDWEGREWEDLTDEEQSDAIDEHIRGMADGLRDTERA